MKLDQKKYDFEEKENNLTKWINFILNIFYSIHNS